MKLNKFAYLYSKPLGNHTLKIMKKIPGNLLKNLEKSWKYHGILSVRKSGNPVIGLFGVNACGGLLLVKMKFSCGRKLNCNVDIFGAFCNVSDPIHKCKFGWQVEDVGACGSV